MKIVKIEPLFVNVSEKSNWTFFRVVTDEGLTGLGEATLQGWEEVQLACLWDPAVSGVMIATDGLAQAALSYTQGIPCRPNRSFAERLLLFIDDPGSDVAELPRFLLQDQLIRLSADDKTFLVAVRI